MTFNDPYLANHSYILTEKLSLEETQHNLECLVNLPLEDEGMRVHFMNFIL